MKRVIHFSGGKTSALMTIMNYREGDIVLFTDTMREHPKTYKFIDDFEKYENIPVTRISYPGGFKGLLEAKNYSIIPNRVRRICTLELKIKTAKRWFRKYHGKVNYESLIGFRYDEERRVKDYDNRVNYIIPKFPLYDAKITKEQVNAYWSNKSYNLEIPPILGNCTLCFLKGKNNIINILMHYPELAKEWIEDEENSLKVGKGNTYLDGVSYKQLLNIAQNNLFKGVDLEELKPSFTCSCTT